MKKPSISILGCGWLGFPLAQHLVSLGFTVKGSTTTPAKIDLLRDNKIKPFLLKCDPILEGQDFDDFFDSDFLFLNIPFKRNLSDPHFYKLQIDSVIEKAIKSSCKKIIFTSSTSIYPDSIQNAYEDMDLILDNPRSSVLYEIERSLLNSKFSVGILRCAGLYGKDRKLNNFLNKNIDLKDSQSLVNLIHLEDCIGIISEILNKDFNKIILNLCSDGHPTRRELYTKAAIKNNSNLPIFSKENGESKNKIVSNSKLKKYLNYKFIHPDPLLDL